MVASLATESPEPWRTRILRCASTDSDDLATFPMFNRFLEQAGERWPAVVLGWLKPLEPSLSRFVPPMLLGLQRSARAADAEALARQWIHDGRCLSEMAWYGRSSNPFNETLLVAVLRRAIEIDDKAAVRSAMAVAGFRFAQEPGSLVDQVFLPGLGHMHQANDTSWVGGGFSMWFYTEIIVALDEAQAAQVLNALLRYPEIEHGAASIVGSVATRWPRAVLQFFSERLGIGCMEDRIPRFRAVPYAMGDEMREALARHPEEMIAEVRTWLKRADPLYHYHAPRFIASVFPELRSPLAERLAALAAGERTDIAFALEVLAGFEGTAGIEPVVRTAVAHLQTSDELLDSAKIALTQTGVVTGEFGFVERYEMQLARMQTWLTDDDERVRAFARSHIVDLERAIAGETRQAEAWRAARRLDYDENLEQPSGDT